MGDTLIIFQGHESGVNKVKLHFGFKRQVMSRDIPSISVPQLGASINNIGHPLKLATFCSNLLCIHSRKANWFIPKQRVNGRSFNLHFYSTYSHKWQARVPLHIYSMSMGIFCSLVRGIELQDCTILLRCFSQRKPPLHN